MPYFVIEQTADALNERRKSIKGSKILVLGLAYKRDIDDLRESPSLTIIELLREKGAIVSYNDPLLPHGGPRPPLRPEHDQHAARKPRASTTPCSSSPITPATITAPSSNKRSWSIDTRNATKGIDSPKIVRC